MALMMSPRTIEEAGGFVTQYESIRPSGQRRVTKPVQCLQEKTEEEISLENFSEQLIWAVLNNSTNNSPAPKTNWSGQAPRPGQTWKKD